jgi:prepilin-type N-terminal cleavage/methylation domain-containing protein
VARSRGFTLLELLIVIVIIGILAAVLIPRFANSREKAFVSAMKSDLRNLATAEESYYYDYATYAPSLAVLGTFNPSAGVAVALTQATQGGWSATASSANSLRQCFLFVGSANPVGVATAEGQITCN